MRNDPRYQGRKVSVKVGVARLVFDEEAAARSFCPTAAAYCSGECCLLIVQEVANCQSPLKDFYEPGATGIPVGLAIARVGPCQLVIAWLSKCLSLVTHMICSR